MVSSPGSAVGGMPLPRADPGPSDRGEGGARPGSIRRWEGGSKASPAFSCLVRGCHVRMGWPCRGSGPCILGPHPSQPGIPASWGGHPCR